MKPSRFGNPIKISVSFILFFIFLLSSYENNSNVISSESSIQKDWKSLFVYLEFYLGLHL